jgi:AcrR family transcriptional regulator
MGRPAKGTRPIVDPSLTATFWRELTGEPDPAQRDQFLWLTIHHVQKMGLAQFTVSRVAKMLGYSVAMVNHLFGSRDGLIAECAQVVHHKYAQEVVDDTESAARTPKARLEAHIRSRYERGRLLRGWSQVLNYPFYSFESPEIAYARAGSSFNDSYGRNLLYLTQLVLDVRAGHVSDIPLSPDEFPRNAIAIDKVAFLHAVTIGTTTAGAVMWMAGRIDNGADTPEMLNLVSTMIEPQLRLLVDGIPAR